MATELFSAKNVSAEGVREAFEAALFDVSFDDDGDLIVRDRYTVIVSVHPSHTIRFFCVFGIKEDAGEEAGFALCNRINDGLIVIRASLHGAKTLLIDWYLPCNGGIGRKAVVLALRMFTELVGSMAQYDTEGIIE